MPHTIDIVVPVYRGEAETRACLESVLAARLRHPAEVVVVDDASPEPAISAWLRELRGAGRITLIAHAANRGFVASVNEAMALHPERDVVLLNSDTEVAEGWLDRLAAHVAADAAIGTVTPFSNNATICSYPRPLQANPLPPGETTATLDAAFAVANAGTREDIVTAVGFCMYIARACLARVGAFDEARYGRGYGEEVDFCMRAARAGFRNVAAADVFVRHVGEVSFAGTGEGRRLEAQAIVDRLYPEFQVNLRAFLAADPLLEARRRADLERLRRSPRPRVLMVSHAHAGGVRRHVHELARMLEPDAEVLLLQPHVESYVSLTWLREGEAFQAWFHKAGEWPRLVSLLTALAISRLHLHHVHGLPQAVLDLPRALGCPWDATLHDQFAICPRYHQTGPDARYCGEPERRCMRCLEGGPAQWPLSIAQWREAFGDFLRGAARVIAPSRDAAERVRRYLPGVEPLVRPHPQADRAEPAPIRVLVPGALSGEKGLGVLEACVRDARERGLPLHFHVVGFVARPLAVWPEAPLTISGEFPEGTLAARLALERGDAALFPAQCPETFSYTLTAVLAAGLPVVASDLGSFPERLAGRDDARLVPWDAPAREFNDALLAVARRSASQAPGAATVGDAHAYRVEYLEALAGYRAQPEEALPALPREHFVLPAERPAMGTLVQLFDDGVVCGRASSLAELRQRAVALEAELRRLEGEHRRLHGDALALRARAEEAEKALAAAAARAEALERSTSWRLTAPLRALVQRLKPRRR